MPQRSPLRTELEGFAFDADRLWRITGPNFVCGMTDYNWEITGYAPLLKKLLGVQYSGNASYVLDQARKRGYKVECVEDRNIGRWRPSK